MNKIVTLAVVGGALVTIGTMRYLGYKRKVKEFEEARESIINAFNQSLYGWDDAVSAARAAYEAAEASNISMAANQQAMDMAMIAHDQATNIF